jgi:hypothetical protein
LKDTAGWLSEEEIDQITRLIDKLDYSSFDFLQLDVGTVKLAGKGAAPRAQPVTGPAIVAARAQPEPIVRRRLLPLAQPLRSTTLPSPAVVPAPVLVAPPAKLAVEGGAVGIVAPLLGIFNSKPRSLFAAVRQSPRPSATGTTVCLIEIP